MSSEKEPRARVERPLTGQPTRVDQDYQQALERVAYEAGLGPDELQKRLRETADTLEPTKLCLTFGELEAFPDISEGRKPHVDECRFCQALLQSLEPTPLEVPRFVEDAIELQGKPNPRRKVSWAASFAVGFAVAVAVLIFVGVFLPQPILQLGTFKLDPNIKRWYETEYARVEAATRREPRDPELLFRKSEILVLLHRQEEARRVLEKAKMNAGENSDEAKRYEKLIQASEAKPSLISTLVRHRE